MALDRCLPAVLLRQNRARGTNHWIVLAFLGTCVSILVMTQGDVTTLAGVYTLSFLSVMALFAVGNMLLKARRAQLPRSERASWPSVLMAFGAVFVGLVGNVLLDPQNVRVFALYFAGTATVVAAMFLRVDLLRGLVFLSNQVLARVREANEGLQRLVGRLVDRIQAGPVIYFARGDDPAELNRAALYALRNEQSDRLIVVHVFDDLSDVPPLLAEHLRQIDHLYPQLRIDFLAVRGVFGPALILALSERLGVPRNYMFIGTPGQTFPHRIEELGGVRLVL